jgi:hypothetical protein
MKAVSMTIENDPNAPDPGAGLAVWTIEVTDRWDRQQWTHRVTYPTREAAIAAAKAEVLQGIKDYCKSATTIEDALTKYRMVAYRYVSGFDSDEWASDVNCSMWKEAVAA